MSDSEAFSDLGGQRGTDLPASYAGYSHRPCPGCGAKPDKVCQFRDAAGKLLPRHMPCWQRTVTPQRGEPVSKVVSPYPPYTGEIKPSPNAAWWRMNLPMNNDADQTFLIQRWEPDQGWMSIEFFDGYDTVIDTGFDKPTAVRLNQWHGGGHIDVLHDECPTPSERWVQLTLRGVVKHPDDPEESA